MVLDNEVPDPRVDVRSHTHPEWGMPKRSSAWLSDSHPLQCEITSNGLPSAKMWLRFFAADAAALALGDAAGAAARFPFAVMARVGPEARDR